MKTTIEQLFNIEYGQREYHNKEWLDGVDGDSMLISSKGEDGGVYGFYDIPVKYKAPFITVQGYGTIGYAFVQEFDCSVDDHMLILFPKKEMSIEELYEVAFQIRQTRWKYRYGRGITPTRLNKEEIVLTESKKDWGKFARQITPPRRAKVEINPPAKKKVFRLNDLFEVEKGRGSYLEKLNAGSTPVISTQTSNNGICGFYDIEPEFSENLITVGRITLNPYVQMDEFTTVPDDMYVLKPKDDVPPEFLFYASAAIRIDSWRFNYSRKVTGRKLEALNLVMPVTPNDDIDMDYIRSIARNTYGYSYLEVTD